MGLGELMGRRFFVPFPFVFQILVDEADAPAGVLVDLLEDLKNLLLFATVGEDFGGVSKRANGDRRDAPVCMISTTR